MGLDGQPEGARRVGSEKSETRLITQAGEGCAREN